MIGLMKRAVKTVARSMDLEIVRVSPVATVAHRRLTMIHHHGIGTVVDVGANIGQYASGLRKSGYKEKILSFEPLSEAYKALAKNALSDPKWRAFQTAIGAEDGEADINIAGNSASSSLLPMLDMHLDNAPASRYRSTERVKMSTLDGVLKDVVSNDSRVLLKIDTQGYEHQVLMGAKSLLRQVYVIECELSLGPLYEGQYLLQGMMKLLDEIGFKPVHIDPGFSDQRTGHCLQVDGIFVRSV